MSGRISDLWGRWEAFWDEREHPVALGLVRILFGICLVYDLVHLWALDLVIPLFGVAEVGGFSDALMREHTPLLYRLLPGTEWVGRGHHTVMTLAALCFTAGFFTRTSAAILLFAWTQFVDVQPYADRGIDTLARLALVILMFSRAGEWGGLDAWWRTGSIWGDGAPVSAAPRRLLVFQLVLMYFCAGIQKTGITWWPMGHYAALYFALQDPAVAAFDFSYVRRTPFFQLVQLGAAGTMVYQWTYPVVLLLMYWHRHPERAGRVASFAIRWRLEWLWIGVGGLFHLILGITMNLGIFPWAMLSLYPVWVKPDGWLAFGRRLGLGPAAPAAGDLAPR